MPFALTVVEAELTFSICGIHGGISDGMDSLLSTVQMPKGVPVATMSIGKSGFINAAILSAEIIALNNKESIEQLIKFKKMGAKL